jgi:hypothetical protein
MDVLRQTGTRCRCETGAFLAQHFKKVRFRESGRQILIKLMPPIQMAVRQAI